MNTREKRCEQENGIDILMYIECAIVDSTKNINIIIIILLWLLYYILHSRIYPYVDIQVQLHNAVQLGSEVTSSKYTGFTFIFVRLDTFTMDNTYHYMYTIIIIIILYYHLYLYGYI